MKITTELLQEMYQRNWKQCKYKGATYFKRKEVFKKMADELNQMSKPQELKVKVPSETVNRNIEVKVTD